MVRLPLSACSNSAAAVAARGREAIATYLPNRDPFPGSDDPKATVAGVARAHLLPHNGTRFNPLLLASHSVRPFLPDCCEDQLCRKGRGARPNWTTHNVRTCSQKSRNQHTQMICLMCPTHAWPPHGRCTDVLSCAWGDRGDVIVVLLFAGGGVTRSTLAHVLRHVCVLLACSVVLCNFYLDFHPPLFLSSLSQDNEQASLQGPF
jgi:hypothetical protein